MSATLNRFDYFSDIQDKFVELRGKGLILSPLDWELIRQWKEDEGVPLHVVLSAIEEVFRNHAAKKNKRPIGSLAYCKPEVEARFAEWKEGQVGSHQEDGSQQEDEGDRNPFAKEVVMAHLTQRRDMLVELRCVPDSERPQGLKIAIDHVATKLYELKTGLEFAERVDAQKLEIGLTELERILESAIESVSSPESRAEALAAAEALFGPYKDKMPPKVYEQQIDAALKKRLRESLGVPRLSLFHM